MLTLTDVDPLLVSEKVLVLVVPTATLPKSRLVAPEVKLEGEPEPDPELFCEIPVPPAQPTNRLSAASTGTSK